MSIRETAGPLAGLRVLDLANEMGVYATKLMADLGAEVIRIEPPAGDPLRRTPPLYRHEGRSVSLYHLFMNTNKRSVTLDLDRPEGQAIFRRLAAKADAVVETFPPGHLAERGLGFADLSRENPALVMTSITPFGQSGPHRDYKGTDLIALAAGGLLYLAGPPDSAPVQAAGWQSYAGASLFAANATLIACWHARETGEGQQVDVSLQECVAMALEQAIPYYDFEGHIRKRRGAGQEEAGTGLFPCRDGYIFMVAGRLSTEASFVRLMNWLKEEGVPGSEAFDDPRWGKLSWRRSEEGKETFCRIFTAFTMTRTKAELAREGQRREISISPVNDLTEVLENEQLLAREWFVPVRHEELGGTFRYPGPPYRFSRTPWSIRRTAPAPGQDTWAVLHGELGLSGDQIDQLYALGVV